MTTLTTTQFLALADSYGAQFQRLADANATTAATDVRTGAANNVGRIVAYGAAAADLIAALLPGANVATAQATTLTKNAVTIWGDALRALNTQAVLGSSGVDAYLTANTIQVGPHFRDLFELVFAGQTLTPANVDAARTETL